MKIFRILKEVFISSIPLVTILTILCVFIVQINPDSLLKLYIGYFLTMVGQSFFLVGLESSILPIGKLVGGSLLKLKKTFFIILFGFLFGLLATVAEPAVTVLSTQVHIIIPFLNKTVLIWVLGAGIGSAVALALFRVLKNIDLRIILFGFYLLIFIFAFLIPDSFVALAFDGSGATTGAVSAPFILTLGLGISATMSKTKTNDDSFGIIGIASLGPIISVFIYSFVIGKPASTQGFTDFKPSSFLTLLKDNVGDSVLAIIPIIIVFLIFQFLFIKLPKKRLVKIILSSLVVFVGLLVFLTGVNYGFFMAGKEIGSFFISFENHNLRLWLPFLGFIMGFAITLSEPSVTILGNQVETVTNGYIKKTTLRLTLSIGIGIAVMLALIKILTDTGGTRYILYFLVPLYFLALLLMPFAPKLFVGLAFDSGGVGSGAIISAFLTPLTLSISSTLQQNPLSSGFGIIAFVAIMPIISIEALGIIYTIKLKNIKNKQTETTIINENIKALSDES